MRPGVYVHIPFCRTKCTYCNFNFVINYPISLPARYQNALLEEIRQFKERSTHRDEAAAEVDSVFFGGGTPSIIPPDYVESVLVACRGTFNLLEDSEISLEINPETLTREHAEQYRRMRINRASLGIQSLNDHELRAIGRIHTADKVIESYHLLRDAGFENVSLDLMLGLPNQTPRSWRNTLREILRLDPNHISIYILEVDPKTKLGQDFQAGKIELPEDALVSDLYSEAIDALEAEGYEHYEISNFARPGYASKHNLKYWSDVPYYGFGAGSHAYFEGARYRNEKDLETYIRLIQETGTACVETTPIDAEINRQEAIFLGLRKIGGINVKTFQSRYRVDLLQAYSSSISKMSDLGLLAFRDNHLKLTRKGLVLSNEVFQEFVK